MSAASPRISTIGRSSAIAAGTGTACLPYFKEAEGWEGDDDEFHGNGGPLLTSRPSDRPFLCHKIIEAGTQIGCEYHEDVNRLPPGAPDNIGWVQQTRRGRRRQSAARTYPAPGAEAARTCRSSPRRWCAASCSTASARSGSSSRAAARCERADAAREVILSGGAIGSPHVLQFRGSATPIISPASASPVVHALPRRRHEHAGPFPRPRHRRDQGCADRQREIARPAVCRRGDALCVHRRAAF